MSERAWATEANSVRSDVAERDAEREYARGFHTALGCMEQLADYLDDDTMGKYAAEKMRQAVKVARGFGPRRGFTSADISDALQNPLGIRR